MMTVAYGVFVFLMWIDGIYCKICHEVKTPIVSKDQQQLLIKQEITRCFATTMDTELFRNESFCEQVFDGVMCWPPTKSGTTRVQRCPSYIHKLNTQGFATRTCLENGEWFVHPELNKTWTNYSDCVDNSTEEIRSVPDIIQENLPRIRLLYNIGYAVSLVSLVIAVFLMLYFRKLHCQRNTIHVNMFISFILRSIICFVKDIDIIPEVYHSYVVDQETSFGQAWVCKMVYTIFFYVLTANFMWIFVEGLFLHTFVSTTRYNVSKHLYRIFLVLGWCVPLLSVIPWVVVRLKFENTLCWNIMDNRFFWIIKGPIMLTNIINLVFFINIIRVLYTKLNAANTKDPKKYRKLARSTLVLIPLFGVYYIVFIAVPICMDPELEVVWMYSEMFFNSFQGFVVALLFCFLNGEVQREVKKSWFRCMIHRRNMSRRSKSIPVSSVVHTSHTCVPDNCNNNGDVELKELVTVCNAENDLKIYSSQDMDEISPILTSQKYM